MTVTRALLTFVAMLLMWINDVIRLYALIGAATFVISGG